MAREKIYVFNQRIEAELKFFDNYLKTRKYKADTIRQYRNYAGRFLAWLEAEQTEVALVKYQQVKTFIFQLRAQDMSIGQINRTLSAIDHYYSYLDIGKSPTGGMKVRGQDRNLKHCFISKADLEVLYYKYKGTDNRTKRNKTMLGLMIYQGITTRELHRLEPHEIDLEQTTIYIKGTSSSNRRRLTLEARQIAALTEYIKVVRQEMLGAIKSGSVKEKSGRKPKRVDYRKLKQQLFFSENGSANLKTSLHHMFKVVQKLNPKVTSGKVIRSSVIVQWLKDYNLREVQYMAGHRFVSSTERYQAFNFDQIEESLEMYHPLR